MRLFLQYISIFIVMLTGLITEADTYMWVDEDGKKHFSDKVPQKHKEKSIKINDRINNVVELEKTNQANAKVLPKREAIKQKSSRSLQTSTPNFYSGQMSCEERKRAFQASLACYQSCRKITYDRQGGGRKIKRGINNSSCGHCRDVTKPNC